MMTNRSIKNSGFSLIEVMIAVVLGLILTGFILSIFVNNKKSYDTNNRVIELNNNLRFAISIIQADLDNAGFYGGLNKNDTITANINTVSSCKSSSGIVLSNATNYPLWGGQASSATEAGCLSGISNGTDYISIRGVRGSVTANNSLDASRVYVRAGATAGEFIGSGMSSTIPNSMNWKYYSNIYFICQNRLLRQSLVYDGSNSQSQWKLEVLVGPELSGSTCSSADSHTEAGIVNMQIQYGRDEDQDGVADFFDDGSNLTSLAHWDQVIEVKISILARSDEDKSYTNKNSFTLGGTTYTPSDNYHYSLISKTFFIHNNWYPIVNDPGVL